MDDFNLANSSELDKRIDLPHHNQNISFSGKDLSLDENLGVEDLRLVLNPFYKSPPSSGKCV